MKSALIFLSAFVSLSAFGFENRTYSCKNANPELPNNTYTIRVLTVDGVELPYVRAHRHFKHSGSDEVTESSVQGIAFVATSGNRELLSLNQIHLEFIDGELVNCKQ